MNKSIFDISVTNENRETMIKLTASDPLSLEVFGTLVYEAEKVEERYKITFSFNTTTNKIDFSIDLSPSLKSSCLILCGINLIGPVLDCYKKNKGNWQGFKRCLEDQGNALGASTLTCVSTCLFS